MVDYRILALGGVGSVGRAALEDVLKHGPSDEIVVGDIDVARARKVVRKIGDRRLDVIRLMRVRSKSCEGLLRVMTL